MLQTLGIYGKTANAQQSMFLGSIGIYFGFKKNSDRVAHCLNLNTKNTTQRRTNHTNKKAAEPYSKGNDGRLSVTKPLSKQLLHFFSVAHLQRAGCEHLHLRLRPDADVLFDRRAFPNVEHVAADALADVLPDDFPADLLPDDLLFLAPPPLDEREYASLVANLLVLVSQ